MYVMSSTTSNVPRVERIRAFDLLRGYFLIVILFNHLYYYPSGLEVLTGRGDLYASSAEGFFIISGIVLGIVRGQKLLAKPFTVGAKLLLKRSVQLYITSVVLAVLFTLLAWVFFDNPGVKSTPLPPGTPIWEVIWKAATYQYLYGWADFLRQYAIFIALAPIALWLLRRGLWYVVLAVSFAIWMLFPHLDGSGFMLQPVAWQLVFFSGFVIGFHWPQIHGFWRSISLKNRRRIGNTLVVTTLITIAASALLVFGYKFGGDIGSTLLSWHRGIEDYFYKDRLPIPRLLLGAVWFWGIFYLVRRHEAWIISKVGWLLNPLGVNSLYVYTIQAFLVFFTHLIVVPSQAGQASLPWFVNLIISLALLTIIWVAVKREFLFKIIPR